MNKERTFIGCSQCTTAREHMEHVKQLLDAEPAFEARPPVPRLSEQARRISTALDELAKMGSDVCVVLAAIDAGATLSIGPVGDTSGTISASLLDNAKSRYATGKGTKVVDVLGELASKWGKP